MENSAKNILVAPLNWGLGHATRCIPIIRELEKNGFTPILASDGVALQLLQKEFPHLQSLELPSYEIEYAKTGADFKWKLIKNSPKMIEAIFAEKKIVKKWIAEFDLQGIISDNRLGVHSKKIPSVFMTHQLNVLSGKTTWISSKLHQHFIKKFTECWIPDIQENPNLTGKLGHLKDSSLNLKYLGPLSRLEKKDLPIKYDLMVILSGPEPQRTFLEEKLKSEVLLFKGKVLFIKGIIESEQKTEQHENVAYYNFMTSSEIETAFNESETVLCRSGYTTVMDLAKLQKKAFFIPTPGQFEQEYLAKRLKRNGFVPYAKQDDFKIENLLEVKLFGGLPQLKKEINWKQLLVLFERE
ncbi:MAG: glycosyltransferase [Flavobacterium sp.]|uniref:glycosyltransferase n=1 Tax=Flavobacterium sp. TaxID=239 RepID=UPI003267191A